VLGAKNRGELEKKEPKLKRTQIVEEDGKKVRVR